VFFFSSRRRHTRWPRDWSSDVCSSDLLEAHGIPPIDLVCVNLYEFEKVAAKLDAPLEELIENIDIGGPTMIRAAAKNWQDVAVRSEERRVGKEGRSGGSREY